MNQADRDRLTALVDQLGERVVRERLGLSRLAFARALAGLSVRAGTVALVRAGLPRFADNE